MAQRRLELIEGRLLETKIALESNIGDFEILQYAVPPKYLNAIIIWTFNEISTKKRYASSCFW